MKITLTDSSGRPVTVRAGTLLAFAFLALFGAATLGAYEAHQWDLFKTLSQGLLMIVTGIAGFFWGSSQGSQAKDATIASALNPGDQT